MKKRIIVDTRTVEFLVCDTNQHKGCCGVEVSLSKAFLKREKKVRAAFDRLQVALGKKYDQGIK